MRKRGFTLVELSIVLIIIGLIVGGILAARSMIGTTKIQSFAGQISQYDMAVANFVTKYDTIPGDAKAFGGNNDGLLGSSHNGSQGGAGYNFDQEMGHFWSDLSASGLSIKGSNGGYVDCTAGACLPTIDVNIPRAVLGTYAGFIAITSSARSQTYYAIGQFTAANQIISNPAFTTSDSLAVDKKIDDGAPNSGNMVAGYQDLSGGNILFATGYTPNDFIGATGNGNCFASSQYTTSNTGNNCSLFVRIGAVSGDLK